MLETQVKEEEGVFRIYNPLVMEDVAQFAFKTGKTSIQVIFTTKSGLGEKVFKLNTCTLRKDIFKEGMIGALPILPQDGFGPLLEADNIHQIIVC